MNCHGPSSLPQRQLFSTTSMWQGQALHAAQYLFMERIRGCWQRKYVSEGKPREGALLGSWPSPVPLLHAFLHCGGGGGGGASSP